MRSLFPAAPQGEVKVPQRAPAEAAPKPVKRVAQLEI